MLSIRSSVKVDLGCSPAELVFGTTLRLPSQFFTSSPADTLDPSNYADRLRRFMSDLKVTPTRTHSKPSYIPNDITTCTHVFIRDDTVKAPLQPPYRGPYKVIKRDTKHFTIDKNGKHDNVSLDRLKPAFIEISTDASSTDSNILMPPLEHATKINSDVRKTRSGRQVHFPDRLSF